MGVFHIQTTIAGRSGQGFNFHLQVDGCDTIAALSHLFAAHGVVHGDRLSLVDDGRGGKLIRGRHPIALGVNAFAVAQLPVFRVWEPEE